MKIDPSPTRAVNDRAKDKSIEGKSTDGNRMHRVIEDLEEMSDRECTTTDKHQS
jgi:hypothetical protein